MAEQAKVTSKGQITVPRVVREQLALRTGDVLVFERSGEGYVVRKRVPVSPFDAWVGALEHAAVAEPDALMDELRGEG